MIRNYSDDVSYREMPPLARPHNGLVYTLRLRSVQDKACRSHLQAVDPTFYH